MRTETHDYYRHGTVTLFAALDYLEGKVLAHTAPKHTHRQWLDFLKQIDRETPPELDLHLIVDNYATHKHPRVKRWLRRNPRFHLHFTPTSSSWLNLVERWFRNLTATPWVFSPRKGAHSRNQHVHRQQQPESASLRLECIG